MVLEPQSRSTPRTDWCPSWVDQHQQLCDVARSSTSQIALFGDSIVSNLERYSKVWSRLRHRATNFGIRGDRCEHVLWRLLNGELPTNARYALISVGSNNIHSDTPQNIVDTINAIMEILQKNGQQVVVHGILPRDDPPSGLYSSRYARNTAVASINAKLQTLCDMKNIVFVTASKLMDCSGNIIKSHYYIDRLHLVESGYNIYVDGFIDLFHAPLSGSPRMTDGYAIGQPEILGEYAMET